MSNGGVHSHQRHLNAIVEAAKNKGVKNVYIHAFTDGRDVAPDSGIKFIKKLQEDIKKLGLGEIATISGRFYAMDRDNRWPRIKRAYDAIFHGEGNKASDPVQAMEESYKNKKMDEFVEPVVIEKEGNLLQQLKTMMPFYSSTSVLTVRLNYLVR